MKSTRKIIRFSALVLCIVMAMSVLSSCSWYKEIDKAYTGTTLYASLGDMPTTFDPMYAYLNDNGVQLLSLIYEGLFKYDANGKVVNAMCDSYKWIKRDAKSGEYVAEFTIKESAWSDTVSVTAKDFVFAWQRILNPGNTSEACSLLYDIKNAREIRTGDKVVYELGAYAASDNVLQISFAREVNLDEFIENLASPALVPLREDIVDKVTDWSSCAAILVSNGPFYLKTFKLNDMVRFERNRYYLRDNEVDDMDKYVTPYRIVLYIGRDYEPEEGEEKTFDNVYELNRYLYNEGIVKYYANVGNDYKEEYSSFAKVSSMSTHTYVFNENNPLFANSEVRRALSLAIDRQELVKSATTAATPAKGIVPDGVYELTYGKKAASFRSAAGDLISSTANIEEAKKILKEQGVTSGSFSITVRELDETAVKTAEYVKKVWESLGFSVSINKESARTYDNKEQGYEGLVSDNFLKCYSTGKFDVIAIDVQQITNNAFSALAPYATGFCGTGIDLSQPIDDTIKVKHISGYSSDEYDELIEKAFAETDSTKKAELLHKAEELLMKDMPVMPLYVNGSLRSVSSDISGYKDGYMGVVNFTKMKDKTFVYEPAE